jgi:hypothetical protein
MGIEIGFLGELGFYRIKVKVKLGFSVLGGSRIMLERFRDDNEKIILLEILD